MSSDVLRNVAVHVAIVAQRDDLAWRCHANGNNNANDNDDEYFYLFFLEGGCFVLIMPVATTSNIGIG